MEPAYSYQNDSSSNRLRKMMLIGLGLVVFIVGSIWLVNFLTTGSVSINANDSNANIIISNAGNNNIKHARGHLSTRLRAGQYIITATLNSSSLSQTINIKARTSQQVSLSLKNPVGVEPVSDSVASSIIASSQKLYFLNSRGNLCQIDASNNQAVVNSSVVLQSIQWANSGFGVGISPSGALYTVINGLVSPLNTGIAHDSKYVPVLTVNSQRQIYIAYGPVVYGSGPSGAFKQLYRANSNISYLAAGPGEVVAIVSPDNYAAGSTSITPTIALISSSGSVTQRNLTAFAAAFSPDGKSLVVAGNEGQILDASLNTVDTIPALSLTNPQWLNNDSVAYVVNDQVWLYSLSDRQAHLMANTPRGGSITEMSVSDSSDYIYLGAKLINNSPVIDRVGLLNQVVSPTVYALQSIMPYAGNGYFMSLINFTKMSVLVAPLPPLTNTNAQYIQEATNQLHSLGIDTARLDIRLSN